MIGSGWSVIASTQDAALFAHRESGQLVLAMRGSGFFARDWLGNNLAGGLGLRDQRVHTTIEALKLEALVASGQFTKICVTGHSLGGSLAAAIGAMLHQGQKIQLTVRVFDAPNLAHKAGQYTDGKNVLEEHNLIRRFALEGDVVSQIDLDGNVTSTTRLANPTSPALGKQIIDALVPGAELVHAAQAHKMSLLVDVLSGGGWDGTFSPSTLDSSVNSDDIGKHHDRVQSQTDKNMTFVLDKDGERVEMWLNAPDNVSGAEVPADEMKITMTPETKRNLLYCIETQELVVRKPDGTEVSRQRVEKMVLSKHSVAALNAIRGTLQAQFLNLVTTSSGNRPQLALVLRQCVESGALAFCGSVVGDRIVPLVGGNKLVGGTIGAGAVNAGYNFLLGENKAAMKDLYETTASAVLQHVTSLPLSAGRTVMSSTGSLFGGHGGASATKRDHVTLNPGSSLPNVGFHFDRTTDQWTNRVGQTVIRESHGLGTHLGGAGFDISFGLTSGFESTSASSVVDSRGVTKQEWYDRKFSGALTLSMQVGQKRTAFNVLPAFNNHKREYRYFFREDGGDLTPARMGLANRLLPNPGESTSNTQPVASSESTPAALPALPEDVALATHTDVATSLLEGAAPQEIGRTEHVTSKLVTHHTKQKWWGLISKRWTDTELWGWAQEVGAATITDGVDSAGDHAMLYTQMDFDTVLTQFHDKNGRRQQERVSSRMHDKVRVASRQDGRDVAPERTRTRMLEDSTQVTSTEHDLHAMVRTRTEEKPIPEKPIPGKLTTTWQILEKILGPSEQDRVVNKETHHIGTGLHISRGPDVRESLERGHRTVKTDVILQESFMDLREVATETHRDTCPESYVKACRDWGLHPTPSTTVVISPLAQTRYEGGAKRRVQGTETTIQTAHESKQLQKGGLFIQSTDSVTQITRHYEASSEPATVGDAGASDAMKPLHEFGTPNRQ
jgi:hypothetical protein